MPPKAKFTREEIVDAAFEIARKEGYSAITARRLGADLGSSARPIFSVFNSMEEVLECVRHKSVALFNSYIRRGLKDQGFKGSGMDYIQFAIDEPVLFREMFMTDLGVTVNLDTIMQKDDNYSLVIDTIMQMYGITQESAVKLYRYMFIISHGIATLCANHMCVFTEKEIDEMLTLGFTGIGMLLMKQK